MSTPDPVSVAEFARLTEPHHRQLYGIALSLCRDPDQAADLTQEALVRAFKAFDRFRPGAPVLPWLRQILRNIYLDTLKTGRARHEVAGHETAAAEQAWTTSADPGDDPLARLERARVAAWVREEIAALHPDHQQVLELCVMQELGFAEAAEIAGLPVGTVASRLARARAQLRERVLRREARERREERDGLMDVDSRPGRRPSEGSVRPEQARKSK